MRRIYHRFPQRCDLTFYMDRPFATVIQCLQNLHNSHQTGRKGDDLVKLHFIVDVAESKTRFEPVNLYADLVESTSETADFRISLNETILTPDRRIPVSESIFFFRVTDAGSQCECFAVKEGSKGSKDAMDLKNLLTGACE